MDYEKDLEAIKQIKDAFVESIENIGSEHPEIFANGRFGVWATSALAELLCVSAKSIGLEKDMVMEAIEQNWNHNAMSDSVLN